MHLLERKDAGEIESIDFSWEVKLATDESAAGTIEGYASVWNIMDRGGDMMMQGAFRKSLAQWKKDKALPPMLWQHNSSEPIGVWTAIAEDEKGLRVAGELLLDIEEGQKAYARLKKGAVRGLSIGYRCVEHEMDRTTGMRKLKQVELWEISLVTIPMLKEAQISGVKSEFDAPAWERAFREGGLSNREAKLATSIARKLALRDGERPGQASRDGATELLMSLRRAAEKLRP